MINKKIKILILISFFNILLINDTLSSEKDNFLTLKYNRVKVRQGPSFEYPVIITCLSSSFQKKHIPTF